jgi:hypothetical protein
MIEILFLNAFFIFEFCKSFFKKFVIKAEKLCFPDNTSFIFEKLFPIWHKFKL